MCFRGVVRISGLKGGGDWPIKAAGQTDQALRVCRQFVSTDYAFAGLCVFRHTQFHECYKTAEVLVTSAIAHEDGDGAKAFMVGFLNADLGADMCLEPVLLSAEMKSRRASRDYTDIA